jgi:hypothetical protein
VKLSDHQIEDLKMKGVAKLLELYPAVNGHILFTHVEEPVMGGRNISNRKEKYEFPIGSTTEIQVGTIYF